MAVLVDMLFFNQPWIGVAERAPLTSTELAEGDRHVREATAKTLGVSTADVEAWLESWKQAMHGPRRPPADAARQEDAHRRGTGRRGGRQH